jgi:4a-hydroxytetrahydrobiopterin dehydratase
LPCFGCCARLLIPQAHDVGKPFTGDSFAKDLRQRLGELGWRRCSGRDKEAQMTDGMSPTQFHESEGVEDWRVIGDGACAHFRAGSFAASARLVQAISQLPGVEDHKPDVDLRHDGVTVRLITYDGDYYGMSQRDVEMARQISAAARRLGLTADPSAVQSLLVIPGATSTAEVIPFWRAALGYEPRRDSPAEDLVDPRGRGPGFWFEQMRQPRADGGGAIHIATWVPYEQAAGRIAAALAAGGRMVRDQFAPSWWTLADAAGNEIDIATTRGRD